MESSGTELLFSLLFFCSGEAQGCAGPNFGEPPQWVRSETVLATLDLVLVRQMGTPPLTQ